MQLHFWLSSIQLPLRYNALPIKTFLCQARRLIQRSAKRSNKKTKAVRPHSKTMPTYLPSTPRLRVHDTRPPLLSGMGILPSPHPE